MFNEDVRQCLISQWAQLTTGDSQVSSSLDSLTNYFSTDSTAVADLADQEFLKYLNYAAEGWHQDQTDTLVRKLPSVVSHEIVKRVLSLGSLVVKVEPEELRDAVGKEIRAMGINIERNGNRGALE